MIARLLSPASSLILLTLLFSACVNEFENIEESTPTIIPQEIITTSLYGKVMNEQGAPVENATVELANAPIPMTTTTDTYGQFEFIDINVKGRSAFLKVNAEGKLKGFRRASVLANSLNYTEVQLWDKEVAGRINAQTGGLVSTSEGASLSLPANAVVDQNGNPYAGEISVVMQWIDPSSDQLYRQLVGDLSGIDQAGNDVVLGTFGMMGVELLDEAGNELQIAENMRAELTWPVPQSRMSEAPQTIPLWSYDEVLGTWIEEEIAAQQGNTFVGQVSHFSYWNLDWKGASISVTGNVTYKGSPGQVLNTFRATIRNPLFGESGGFLTADGSFQFDRFPANEVFSLEIKNICGEALFSKEIGPFSQNEDIGTINILEDETEETIVRGIARDCAQNPIEGAFVQLLLDSTNYYTGLTEADGSFELRIPFCGSSTTADLFILDKVNTLVSDPEPIEWSSQGPLELGDIRVCDQAPAFIQMTLDTNEVFFGPPVDRLYYIQESGAQPYAVFGTESNKGFVQIKLDALVTEKGSYSSAEHVFIYNDGSNFNTYQPNIPADLTIEINEYEASPDAYVGGRFQGSIRLDTTAQGRDIPISGSFRIQKQ